jgi:FkbM family methyltransferase
MIKDLVYDVGLCDGEDTAYYLSKGLRVLAIDANPIAVEQAVKRFADAIAAKRLQILNVGISKQEGSLPFWICDTYPEWSSFFQPIASRNGVRHHQVIIPCRRFRSVLAEFGVPRHLKLDIEGSEIHCLRDLSGPDLPEYVSFEKAGHEVYALQLLRDLGYTKFKLVSQYHFLPVEFPATGEQRRYEAASRLANSRNFFVRAARKIGLRRWIDCEIRRSRMRAGWSFPLGSSGPLADETIGSWQTHAEIVETLARAEKAWHCGEPSIFWNSEGRSFWADFHAHRLT